MRVKYTAGELDPNHQIIDGIKSALETSHAKRARTTLRAIDTIDLEGDGTESSLDQKIAFICGTLNCTCEQIEDEAIFRR